MELLHRDSLVEGGFAGLKEHRLIKDSKVFGASANTDGSWAGIGSFVYLADARFMPHGETRMHKHHEIDVISVIVDGRIAHKGSLENGKDLSVNDVQVQRAGGDGFSHNEINPDDEWNRMIQFWVLPEQAGQASDYKVYHLSTGELTRIYGDDTEKPTNFPSKTKIDVGLVTKGQTVELNASFLAYLTRGKGTANGEAIQDGDLIRGDSLSFEATEDVQIIIVRI